MMNESNLEQGALLQGQEVKIDSRILRVRSYVASLVLKSKSPVIWISCGSDLRDV